MSKPKEDIVFNGSIDAPLEGQLVYQHGFDVHGWLYESNADIREIRVTANGTVVGSTELFYARPDVAKAFNRQDMLRVGYTVRCAIPEDMRGSHRIELEFEMLGRGLGASRSLGKRLVRLSEVDYRQHGHGAILSDGAHGFLKREQVYGSGPPSPLADPLCVTLVTRYMDPQATVLDVGCGIGAWCGPLTSHGAQWTGCETRADFVDHMLRAGLQVVRVDGGQLPFGDGAFEETVTIEVLEHVSDPEAFLSEVSRVSRRGGFFSVPNFAAIPVTASFYALPWHMLESDHKNFFTARSLERLLAHYYTKVETFEYGPLANFHSSEGLEIMNQVFAIARH